MIRFDQNLVTDVALVKEYPVDRTFTHSLPQAKLLLCTQPRARLNPRRESLASLVWFHRCMSDVLRPPPPSLQMSPSFARLRSARCRRALSARASSGQHVRLFLGSRASGSSELEGRGRTARVWAAGRPSPTRTRSGTLRSVQRLHDLAARVGWGVAGRGAAGRGAGHGHCFGPWAVPYPAEGGGKTPARGVTTRTRCFRHPAYPECVV